MNSITSAELALWQRGGLDFALLDVRRARARREQGGDIAGATWLDPALWLDWKDEVVRSNAARPVVLYCAHGHEISQGLAAALAAMGADARTLAGGFSAWSADGRPATPVQEDRP